MKIQTFFKGILGLIIHFYRYFFQRKRVVKFLIFADGRTGGELLCNLLDSHLKIRCETEILAAPKRLFLKLFMNARCVLFQTDAYGFRAKLYHFHNGQKIKNLQGFLDNLYNSGWKIIYLRRNDTFRQALSMYIANKRKLYVVEQGEHRNLDTLKEKIHVDCDRIIKMVGNLENARKDYDRIIEKIPYLTINYENDLLKSGTHQKTVDRICDYLGISHAPCNTSLVKISPESLPDYIFNYPELIRCMVKAGYSRFLPNDKK